MSDFKSEQLSLQGSAILSGQFARDNSMRDVLEIVMQSRDVEFGLLKVLSKDLRGSIAISFGSTIVGAQNTSQNTAGITALKALLAADSGMFVFTQAQELPPEVQQSLEIPLQSLLEWRPQGVPPDMVPLLSQALAPWETAQSAEPRAPHPLAITVEIGPVDPSQVKAEVAATWVPQAPSASPAGPLPSVRPFVPPPPDQQVTSGDPWSKSDLDAIGRIEMPQEEPKSGLAQSGRFKGPGAVDDPQAKSTRMKTSELSVSGRYRPDPDQSASGKFIAAEMASLLPEIMPDDRRQLLEAQEEKSAGKLSVLLLGAIFISILIISFTAFQCYMIMNTKRISPLDTALEQFKTGQFTEAAPNIDAFLQTDQKNDSARLLKAANLIGLKQYDQAVKECDLLLATNKDDLDALWLRSLCKAQLADYKSAALDADQFLKQGNGEREAIRSQVLAVRAFCQLKLGSVDKAIADYTEAIKLDETNTQLSTSRAFVKTLKKQK